ncbi:hypothetical protein [Bradyrhizobium sp. BRP56]|uniref:hypothetical protein n=1 Tax=Bradyrhizobium sp. BRP56 TaxID=2793819 RepID=UPI001CD6F2EE|nr:hypothetical protein [Bradyrhizobium sp. BRP56]MCA1401333.1 hypothetical protein [Bradyrhizobium sp. BRP56]
MGQGGEKVPPKREASSIVRYPRSTATIRSVSRVWFELTDKKAFDECIRLSTQWMGTRAGIKLPKGALEGQAFDVTDVLGANPTRAVRLTAKDGSIWAARSDYPDPEFPRLWVTEFFVEKRQGQLARFGAQLTCVIRGESPEFEITRPTAVRRVLESLSAEADGWQLSETPHQLVIEDLSSFLDLVYNPDRRLPVIVVAEDQSGNVQISSDTLGRHCAGAAHLFYLPMPTAWALTREVGKRMSVFNGATRIYMPGLAEDNEDPYRHPLWLPNNVREDQLRRELVRRVLPFDFLRPNAAAEFPRFSAVRDLVQTRGATSRSVNRVDGLQLQIEELEEDRDTWQGLAISEQERTRALDSEIERLKSEVARLESKNSALDYALKNKTTEQEEKQPTERILDSYEDLEDWAEEVLGDALYIHPAAIKDCRKNGHDGMRGRIEATLKIIRDYVVPARTTNSLEAARLAAEKLGELGVEDTPCFVKREEAKRTAGYSVPYGNDDTRVLYDHFKYGNGYDNANQFRMYYFWDAERKRLVIGKMPSHLRNNLTN